MNGVLVGAVSGIALTLAYVGYRRLRGCNGGHVYGEKEWQNRWRVIPFGDDERVAVQRKYVKRCQRFDCDGTVEGYETVRGEVYAESLADAIGDAVDVHYQCPNCTEAIPSSDIEGEYHTVPPNHHLLEKCTSCGEVERTSHWFCLSHEEVK